MLFKGTQNPSIYQYKIHNIHKQEKNQSIDIDIEVIVIILQADKNVKSYYKFDGVKTKHKDNEERNKQYKKTTK